MKSLRQHFMRPGAKEIGKVTLPIVPEALKIPALKYSEREIELVTKAFTQGRCSKESLGDYLKRIGAK